MGRVHADAAFARPALPVAGDVDSARRRCDGAAGTDATRIGDRPARLACRCGVSGPACLGVPPGRHARGFWTSWRRPRRLGAAACDRDFVTWRQMARRACGGSTALHAADVDAGRRPGRIAPFAHAGNPRLIVPTASSATSRVRPGSSRHYMTGGGGAALPASLAPLRGDRVAPRDLLLPDTGRRRWTATAAASSGRGAATRAATVTTPI